MMRRRERVRRLRGIRLGAAIDEACGVSVGDGIEGFEVWVWVWVWREMKEWWNNTTV